MKLENTRRFYVRLRRASRQLEQKRWGKLPRRSWLTPLASGAQSDDCFRRSLQSSRCRAFMKWIVVATILLVSSLWSAVFAPFGPSRAASFQRTPRPVQVDEPQIRSRAPARRFHDRVRRAHAHASEADEPEAATWQRVDRYIHEIVPFFNVVAYYQVGYRVAKRVLNLFYKVTVEYERPRRDRQACRGTPW